MRLISPLSLISTVNLLSNPEDFLHRPPVKMKNAKNKSYKHAIWESAEGLFRMEFRISLGLCVCVSLESELCMRGSQGVGKWNQLHFKVMFGFVKGVFVCVGVRAGGVGEKTEEFDELLWNITCAEAFLPLSPQRIMGRNVKGGGLMDLVCCFFEGKVKGW